MNDPLSSQVRSAHHAAGENRQDLRNVVDTRICDIRPVPAMQLQRIGYVGGQTLKIRLPDIGETALSSSEIEIAICEGISAQTAGEGVKA